MKDANFTAQINSQGYYEAQPRPQQAALDKFYQETYFSAGVTSTYQSNYSEDEIRQKKLRADCVTELLSQNITSKEPIEFLEVGCGEGFVTQSAKAKGWNVVAVDYQTDPVKKFNPEAASLVVARDPNIFLSELISANLKKDIIVLQNVLEHVLKPEILLKQLKDLLSEGGCILVQVPNDFSELQELALKSKRIDREYWFLPPQHLNYFNENSLYSLARSVGLDIVDGITDFPIEMYLWGAESNYTSDKDSGKYAHQARITLDLFFSRKGIKKYLQLYRAAFAVGLGRNICAVFKKA